MGEAQELLSTGTATLGLVQCWPPVSPISQTELLAGLSVLGLQAGLAHRPPQTLSDLREDGGTDLGHASPGVPTWASEKARWSFLGRQGYLPTGQARPPCKPYTSLGNKEPWEHCRSGGSHLTAAWKRPSLSKLPQKDQEVPTRLCPSKPILVLPWVGSRPACQGWRYKEEPGPRPGLSSHPLTSLDSQLSEHPLQSASALATPQHSHTPQENPGEADDPGGTAPFPAFLQGVSFWAWTVLTIRVSLLSMSSVIESFLQLHSQVHHTGTLLLAQLERYEPTETEPKREEQGGMSLWA
ncbi:hypothetical protein H920_07310 [Fukomys damarensis]|uniref:Uncharacterized protein n=1 Tax=Fukomys damarensis TaxID=885580 RepID=A0A091E800_FUKDA|nr:hypothetical protein H920_07310 [Fukomys damarensis]